MRLLCCAGLLLLSACGQAGDLYLPDQKPDPDKSATPPASVTPAESTGPSVPVDEKPADDTEEKKTQP